MARITPPRQTIFPEPGVIRPAQPNRYAGLSERVKAQNIRNTVQGITQATDLIGNLADMGYQVDSLLNQKAVGEYEIARSNAEVLYEQAMRQAQEPEPESERIVDTGGAAFVGSPFYRRSDEDLYKMRQMELMKNAYDIGQQLKGRARKEYETWLAIQAPRWKDAMAVAYGNRIKNNALSNMSIAITENINKGNPGEVARLYETAINEGLIDKAQGQIQMVNDVSQAILNTVLNQTIDIADTQGYDAAYQFLDMIVTTDVSEGGVAGLVPEGQLENVRDVVRQRLSDKFEQDEREYKTNVLRPAEDAVQRMVTSYNLGIPYDAEGNVAGFWTVVNAIQTSGMRGTDRQRWLDYLESVRDAKRKGPTESNPITVAKAIEMSVDPTVTPEEMHEWRMKQLKAGNLTAEHAQNFYDDKLRYFENPNWETAGAVGLDLIKEGDITPIQYEDALAKTKEWANTPDGVKAIEQNPDAVVDKMQELVGTAVLDKINTDVNGIVKDIDKEQFDQMNEIIYEVSTAALKTNPNINLWRQPIVFTGTGMDKEFVIRDVLEAVDNIPIKKIAEATDLIPEYFAESDSTDRDGKRLSGYIVLTNTAEGTFDLFKLDDKGHVVFWDANDNKWKTYSDFRFKRRSR